MRFLRARASGRRTVLLLVERRSVRAFAKRKVLAAIADLRQKWLLPSALRIVGVDRALLSDDEFRAVVEEAVGGSDEDLAVPAGLFDQAIVGLCEAGVLPRTEAHSRPWARVIVEKPSRRVWLDLPDRRAARGAGSPPDRGICRTGPMSRAT